MWWLRLQMERGRRTSPSSRQPLTSWFSCCSEVNTSELVQYMLNPITGFSITNYTTHPRELMCSIIKYVTAIFIFCSCGLGLKTHSHLCYYAGTECSVLSETEFLFVLTWPRKMADYNLVKSQFASFHDLRDKHRPTSPRKSVCADVCQCHNTCHIFGHSSLFDKLLGGIPDAGPLVFHYDTLLGMETPIFSTFFPQCPLLVWLDHYLCGIVISA